MTIDDYLAMKKPKLKMMSKQIIDHVGTGAAARKYRERFEVAQNVLADKIGMGRTMLNHIEAGRRGWSEDLLQRYISGVDSLAKN